MSAARRGVATEEMKLVAKDEDVSIDWLIQNVMFVVIETYSDENAYKIFETMNDRGLSLTQTDMLKGYLLSKITTKEDKNELNNFWRQRIGEIKDFYETADIEFFQAWLRCPMTQTTRPRTPLASRGRMHHRRTIGLNIPRRVASPQSPTPFHQAPSNLTVRIKSYNPFEHPSHA